MHQASGQNLVTGWSGGKLSVIYNIIYANKGIGPAFAGCVFELPANVLGFQNCAALGIQSPLLSLISALRSSLREDPSPTPFLINQAFCHQTLLGFLAPLCWIYLMQDLCATCSQGGTVD